MKKKGELKRVLLFAGMLVLLLGALTTAIAQQTTSDILGTVTDPAGAVVPIASVTIENTGTHERQVTTTTSSGDYVFNLLKPGIYSISVTAKGFQSFSVPSLTLAAGDRTRVNAQLSLGSESQTVTVTAAAGVLQTDSSVLSNSIGTQPTQDLPLNGRNFAQLVAVQPGVNEGPSSGGFIGGNDPDDYRPNATFQANGQSEVLNNQMIDGADNYERVIGSISVRPSVDAISEMTVQTNTYTAEVGRTGGAMVNIITKAGTDQFHGDVFEFFRNDIFNTYPFAFGHQLPKAELRQNQFGGSLGGPIKRGKAFFFGSYEGYRLVQGSAPVKSIVPTLSEHSQAVAYAAGNGNGIDFSDAGGPTLSNAQIDPLGASYVAMLPAPNQGTNAYVAGSKNPKTAPFTMRAWTTLSIPTTRRMPGLFTTMFPHTTSPASNFPKSTSMGSLWIRPTGRTPATSITAGCSTISTRSIPTSCSNSKRPMRDPITRAFPRTRGQIRWLLWAGPPLIQMPITPM